MKALAVAMLLAIAVVFSFSGCADKPNPVEGLVSESSAAPALSKATVINSNTVIPLDFVIPEDPTGCIGGSLHVTGELHVVTQMVLDGSGMWKLKMYHRNREHVTAETESGVIYKFIGVYNWPRKTGEGAWTATIVDKSRLLGPPGEPSAILENFVHLTWTPNGDVSVEWYNPRLECW